MKKEQLSDALGQVEDDLLLAAEQKRKKRRFPWLALVAAVACLSLILGLGIPALREGKTPDTQPLGTGDSPVLLDADAPRVLKNPVYPLSAPYPTEDFTNWDAYAAEYERWEQDRGAASAAAKASDSAVDAFTEGTVPAFLQGAEEENRVYSPINVYLALSMLAELTDGQSRAQILELLGVSDIESLRETAGAVWRANYSDDGALTSILANSLWLNEGVSYKQETMDILAQQYYAASHQGTMGSEEYNELLRAWLNEQTGGRLAEQAENIELSAECILALASTVYYQGKWAEEFSEQLSHEDVFYAPAGERAVEYMEQELCDQVYWGEGYTAVRKAMETGGYMWLILPEEGVSVDQLLERGEALSMTRSGTWENSKTATIHLKMPKFDVVSQMDLIEGMQRLGITDIFDYTVSDFSPTTEEYDDLFVSQINHAARVTVDEEGCTAAAFTVMMVESTSAQIDKDEIWFTLDRPFLFVLTGVSDQPLFVGVVNEPG